MERVRSVAQRVTDGRGFELVDYLAVPEVYVGCGFAAWKLGARA